MFSLYKYLWYIVNIFIIDKEYICPKTNFIMKNGLQLKVEHEGDSKFVVFDYRECFDKNTNEMDFFSEKFFFEDYVKSLNNLWENGECSLEGKLGKVNLTWNKEISLVMTQGNYSINLLGVKFKEVYSTGMFLKDPNKNSYIQDLGK